MKTLLTLLLVLAGIPKLLWAADPPPLPPPAKADVVVREVRYEGKLTDNEARFVIDLDGESLSKTEVSLPLFEGDVALVTPKLPPGLRLTREKNQYQLLVSKPGAFKARLELVAKITRTEPWNQISFVGPASTIAAVSAQASGVGIELQLLNGTPVASVQKDGTARVSGFLGADRTLSVRWQSKITEAARKVVMTSETTASAHITSSVIKFTTHLRYEVVQGTVSKLTIALPVTHALTRVEGDQIRDWQAKIEGDRQLLTVEFVKPLEKSYRLTVLSEQTVDTTPFSATLTLPQPLDSERESGALTLSAEDTLVETEAVSGLRQVNAAAGQLAAYKFDGRPALKTTVRRIEPLINTVARMTTRLEESRLLATHSLTVNVEKAGIYALELSPLGSFTVADVHGEGIEDWKAREGKLLVNFRTRVMGSYRLEVQLEQALKALPEKFTVTPLRVTGATKETAQVGVTAAAGIRVKTSELVGLREVAVTALAARTDEQLAYTVDQPNWQLTVAAERLAPRVLAEVFNLITVGDGLVSGSATIRYNIVNQGVQEFQVRLPVHWKNIEFVGPNIRRKEQKGDVWNLSLQDKTWGGYTLVVTYDFQFDPKQAKFPVGGIHTLGVDRETGSVAVTSAASVQLREESGTDINRVDEFDLVETDRALITRPVLLAYRYTGDKYDLNVEMTRFAEQRVLDAAADRTQLTTVLTDDGQMLTQATFMVKNNDRQFQRFTLPEGAEFWSCFVAGEAVKPAQEGKTVLVPLRKGANRDEAYPVEIVYRQKTESLKTFMPRSLALAAPKTDMQTTFAEWELFIPITHRPYNFGGNMTIAPGTTYGLSDAWRACVEFYSNLYEAFSLNQPIVQGAVVLFVVMLFAALILLLAKRRGWRMATAAISIVATIMVLAVMLLPAIQSSRDRNRRSSSLGNLTQGGLVYNARKSLDMMDRKSAPQPSAPLAPPPQPINGRARSSAPKPPSSDKSDVIAAGSDGNWTVSEAAVESNSAVAGVGRAGEKPNWMPGGFARGGAVPASPAVAGIRPLRIEVPKTGIRLEFTKVLNVQNDPLTVQTSLVTFFARNLTLAILEIVAFLAGLFLVWRQWRRAQSGSFTLALGGALILGSIGGYLVVQRLLHLAFIALPPLLILATVIWLVWRWLKAQKKESEPTSGGGAIPPAIAAIGLMFLLAGTANAAEPVGAKTRVEPTIPSASYVGIIHEQVAQVEATVQLTATTANQAVVLFEEEVAIKEFSSLPIGAKLVRDEKTKTVRVELPRKGDFTLRVKFLVKVSGDVTKRRVAFGIPPALSSQVAMTIDEPEAGVEFPTAVSHKTHTEKQQTLVEGVIGAGQRVDVSWTPRMKKATEIAATVFCQNATLVTLGSGVMNVRAALEYQVTQGELREARVRLPSGQKLLRVEGEGIRTWAVKEENQQPILVVELAKGVSPSWRLTVETEKVLEKLPAQITVEIPHALDVKRESGWIGFSTGEELGVFVEKATELQKVNAEEFIRAWSVERGIVDKKIHSDAPPALPALTTSYRFQKPEFALAVRVEQMQPQLEAVVRNRFLVGTDQDSVVAQVDYTIKKAGVFVLRLALPLEYRVESVSGDQVAQWTEKTEKETRLLEVALKERVLGAYSLRVHLIKPRRELPKTVEVVGVHPLETQKLSGFVIVATETGVQAKSDALEGLSEVPAGTVAEAGNALAYKYLLSEPTARAGWKLMVATELVEPWVRAEVVNWVTLTESLVSGRALVRYDIANAPVKSFRLKVPAAFKNVEIVGANIRRRDQNDDEWRVELQTKVIGTYQLAVTWDQPLDLKQNDGALTVGGIEVLDVERETGALAVIAKSPLQVAAKTASEELKQVDRRELPAWAGQANDATVLAYRYLRAGYQLALTVKRLDEAKVLQALVDNIRLTTVVADDGQMMTEMALDVRNNGRQYLEVTLPKDAQLWSAFVSGLAVRPSMHEGKLLLPLERVGAGDAAIPVELTYVGKGKFPATSGRVALGAPTLDVPIKNARWNLYLPPDYRYKSFGGSMTHEAEAAPEYRAYTLSEYQQVEVGNKTVQKAAAADNLRQLGEALKEGRYMDANGAYSRARELGRGEDDRAKQEFSQLEMELKKSQAQNFLSQSNENTVNGKIQIDQGEQLVAEKQFACVSDAQAMVTVRTQNLRVNLPTRGVSHLFQQVLQTEISKPMTIEFSAANARSTSWLVCVSYLLVAFVFLWALVASLQTLCRSARA